MISAKDMARHCWTLPSHSCPFPLWDYFLVHNSRSGPLDRRGPQLWQTLGREQAQHQDFQTWAHAPEAGKAGYSQGACDILTYHTLECTAQSRHQDHCPGVSRVDLCPGAWLGDGAILSSVDQH